jgi:hypothetical protein
VIFDVSFAFTAVVRVFAVSEKPQFYADSLRVVLLQMGGAGV